MKTTFSNHEICHVFVSQMQTHGKSANMFFEHSEIYSYGRHYLLAKIISNPKGLQAIMINNLGYSNTTAKHIGYITSASRHMKQFFTQDVQYDQVYDRLEFLYRKFIVARKPEMYLNEVEHIKAKMKEYLDWSGLPMNKGVFEQFERFNVLESQERENMLEQIKKERARQLRLKKQEEKRRQEAFQERLEQFFNHEISYIYGTSNNAYLRVSKDGTNVQTTMGVSIELRKAKMLYSMIKEGMNVIGKHIDHYTINKCDKNVLVVGCHTIQMSHVHEIGEKILNM